MVVSSAEFQAPREQHNHGSGTFIGGGNFGHIEMVDARTKAVLEKLSKDAPDLGRLLSKALRDGVISPDTVFALEHAARNINADVADALLVAGRNINEDVAGSLRYAGNRINEVVSHEMSARAEELKRVAERFEAAISRLDPSHDTGPVDRLHNLVQIMDAEVERVEHALAPLLPRIIINWRATVYAFFWGVAAGVVAVIAIYMAIQ
jgi:hypothetical protein